MVPVRAVGALLLVCPGTGAFDLRIKRQTRGHHQDEDDGDGNEQSSL